MIKNIFIPEAIGSYYIFPQRIVGCEIGKNQVFATVIRAYRRTRIVERFVEEVFDGDPTLTYQEKASGALSRVLATIGTFDAINTALSSSSVIFKELTLPFTDPQKIKLVVPFEVEPLLPFELNQATLDSIIIHQSEGSSEILVAAVKNETLAEHIQIFTNIGISPAKVTVDLLELYGIYQEIPEYRSIKGAVVLLDLELDSIRIAVIIDGQLKALRVLPKGMIALTRSFGDAQGLDLSQALDQFRRFGIDSSNPQARTLAIEFFSDVQFTIQALLSRIHPTPQLERIIATGFGEEVKGMNEILRELIAVPCESLLVHKIIQNSTITVKHTASIPSRFAVSLGTALSSAITREFNLRQIYSGQMSEKLLTRQLMAAGLLIVGILGSFMIYSFVTVHRLNNQAAALEKEAVDRLKKELPALQRTARGSTSLDTLTAEARREVAREKNIWFALSSKNRASFLNYLQELSTRIDAAGLGLVLRRMSITDDSITLEGQVKNFNAARLLEEDLNQSKLFKSVPRLEETKFTAKLILDTSQQS